MPDWASPSGPSRWSRKPPPRASTMAISLPCFTPKAIAARNLSRARSPPRLRGGWCEAPGGVPGLGRLIPSPKTGSDTSLLQAQRHETKFSFRIGDQEQRRLAAFLLELIDPLLQRVRIGDRLLRYLDYHVADIEPLIGGGRLGFHAGDHDALNAVLDLVTLAQIVGHVGEVKAERLLHDRLFWGRRILVGRQRRLLLAVLKTAELNGVTFFLAFSYNDNVHILAHRRIGNDTRQILHLLDFLA